MHVRRQPLHERADPARSHRDPGPACRNGPTIARSAPAARAAGEKVSMKFASTACLLALLAVPTGPDRGVDDAGRVRLVPLRRRAAHAPRLRDREAPAASSNWAGHAVATNLASPTRGSVSAVKGTWIVPDVAPSQSAKTYSAAWIGIDGYDGKTVEQIGTEQDWTPKGPKYYAWFEMYPRYGYRITGFPVSPGDEISAEVRWDGDTHYEMTITNVTQGSTYSTTQRSKRARDDCAEWIVEAPAGVRILRLADFGTTRWTHCSATIEGRVGSIVDPWWQDDLITMQSHVAVKAVASPPGRDGSSFSVTWEHE
jgi:hypothetical protein